MGTNRLKHLYAEELKALYSAEIQMGEALPRMAKAATSPELRAGLEEHLNQTKDHVARLEKIFKASGKARRARNAMARGVLSRKAPK